MKMRISDFLSWGGKRETAAERRKEPRRVAQGPMTAYWAGAGGFLSARGQLHDVGESGAGIGFLIRKQIPLGVPVWIVTAAGETQGGIVAHAYETDGGYRTGANLHLKSTVVEGWGGVQVRWIDSERKMRVAQASLRNGEDGILQVNCSATTPTDVLVLISGPEVSCVCLVKKCEAYGKRFLLEVEAVSDAVMTKRAEAA